MKVHLAIAGIEIFFQSRKAKSAFILWVCLWFLAQSIGGFGFCAPSFRFWPGRPLFCSCFSLSKRLIWMPSFRPAPECCSCLCPVLICPVFIRFLRYDFWQQRQLEKSHGWWSGRGSTWKERALTENIVMQVLLQGGGGKTRWRFCVCLCVFPRSEGANHWTLWRIQLLGGLATLRKPGNQRCVCVCLCVCVSVCLCVRVKLWCAHAPFTFCEL